MTERGVEENHSKDEEIKDLPDLLANHIGTDKKIVEVQTTRLTAPGENYGSIMLKLDVILEDVSDGNRQTMHLVAKKMPTLKLIQEIFNIQVTYKKEVAFYMKMVPALQEFQREMGVKNVIDCFARCYGARISLNRDSETVDEDAALILENLHSSGYKNVDRLLCFDLSTTRLVLKDLANLHATVIALKLKKPEVFHKRVKAFCHDYLPKKDLIQPMQAILKRIVEENDKCKPLALKIRYWGEKEDHRKLREPFATLTHNDMWVNNTMQKFANGVPVDNKIVDFQIYTYRSAASDVFFFLFSSVQLEVLKRCLDSLLKFYHEHFIAVLEMLKCDTSEFGFEKFMEEMRLEAEYEFDHALYFSTFVVQGKKKKSDLTEHSFDPEKLYKDVNDTARRRAWYITLECEKRGWLY